MPVPFAGDEERIEGETLGDAMTGVADELEWAAVEACETGGQGQAASEAGVASRLQWTGGGGGVLGWGAVLEKRLDLPRRRRNFLPIQGKGWGSINRKKGEMTTNEYNVGSR